MTRDADSFMNGHQSSEMERLARPAADAILSVHAHSLRGEVSNEDKVPENTWARRKMSYCHGVEKENESAGL